MKKPVRLQMRLMKQGDIQRSLRIGGFAILWSLCVSAPAYAVLIDPLMCDVTVNGDTIGTITMKVSSFGLGGGLIGIQGLVGDFDVTKKKSDGTTMTVKELEQSLGQDHLNWFQKVVGDTNPQKDSSGNTLTVPYVDPPKGGYNDLWGDDAPWYWNETPKPAGETRPEAGQLSNQVMGSSLAFEDFPSVVEMGKPVAGAKVDFATFLISDFGNKTYQVLSGGISWGITMETVADKGVFPHVTSLAKGATFTTEYATEIKDGFGYSMVPEPFTWVLFGSGFLGVVGRRRRRLP